MNIPSVNFVEAIKTASELATKNYHSKGLNCVRVAGLSSTALIVESYNIHTGDGAHFEVDCDGYCQFGMLVSQDDCAKMCSIDTGANDIIRIVPTTYGAIVFCGESEPMRIESINARFPDVPRLMKIKSNIAA